MTYASRVILYCPAGCTFALTALVEAFLRDRVEFVGIVGKDCNLVEEVIREVLVGDGSAPRRFIATSVHPDEEIDEVVAFANTIGDYQDAPQIVELV